MTEQLLTTSELAAMLSIPRRSVYGLLDAGLPHYRLSEARLRFAPDAVLAWLEARKAGDWNGANGTLHLATPLDAAAPLSQGQGRPRRDQHGEQYRPPPAA